MTVDIEGVFERALSSYRKSNVSSEALEQQFPADVWRVAAEARGEFKDVHLGDLQKAAVNLGYTVTIKDNQVIIKK